MEAKNRHMRGYEDKKQAHIVENTSTILQRRTCPKHESLVSITDNKNDYSIHIVNSKNSHYLVAADRSLLFKLFNEGNIDYLTERPS